MKTIFQFLLILLLFSCGGDGLQQMSEDDLISRIVNDQMPNPQNVKYYNERGVQISYDSLIRLEYTGKYFEDYFINKSNEIVKIIIRPKTKKDDILLARINKGVMAQEKQAKNLRIIPIECFDKVNILQGVFDRDQAMRGLASSIDPQIDHENLEIIVSFIDQCGIPTLEEVNDVQMAGIWAVLQHAPAYYQSKYIPLLEASAENGDIKWSVIALMKDRALMYEGEPQIYGSQVRNGELYDLFEPQFVDQRRREVGLDPLEDYLDRFGIAFDIAQKEK